MTNPAIASRIPLVCRPKPPGLPLRARIAELTALTVEPPGADHHQRVARASGVLNFAALIASDTGLPDLAAGLCATFVPRFTRDLPRAQQVLIKGAVLEDLASLGRLTGKPGELLRTAWDEALRWRELIRLRTDVPISWPSTSMPAAIPPAPEVVGQLGLWQ